MTRDISWRPIGSRYRQERLRVLGWVVVLIVLNILVIWYHGDPRRLLNQHESGAVGSSHHLKHQKIHE